MVKPEELRPILESNAELFGSCKICGTGRMLLFNRDYVMCPAGCEPMFPSPGKDITLDFRADSLRRAKIRKRDLEA